MDLKIFKKELYSKASDITVPMHIIEDHFSILLKSIKIPYVFCNPPYLMRSSLNNLNEIFPNVSRCSYNPIVEKINLQRCNYPEQQVFYCCVPSESKQVSSSLTTLLETGIEYITNKNRQASIFTLSKWCTLRPLLLYMLPFSTISFEKNKDFRILNERIRPYIDTEFHNRPDEKKAFFEFFEMMCNIFITQEQKQFYYRMSAAFYNALVKRAKKENFKMDGLLYPSANTQASGMNAVLKKELIDNKIIFCEEVSMHEMERHESDPYTVGFLKVSDTLKPDENGNFKLIFRNDEEFNTQPIHEFKFLF